MNKLDISTTQISKIIVHKVGNKTRDEGYTLSSDEMGSDKNINDLILLHYLSPITRSEAEFQFHHESDINLNAVSKFSRMIFDSPANFTMQSQNIAKHLYSNTTHPKIASGELIVVLFEKIIQNNKTYKALGLFSIEAKDPFFDVSTKDGVLQLKSRTGISLSRLQKVAIILSDDGPVFAADNVNLRTKYWFDSFLKATSRGTPQAYAKFGGALLSAVSKSIETPEKALEFSNLIKTDLESCDEVSLEDLKEISNKFVNTETVSRIFSGLQDKHGFAPSDSQPIKTSSLGKFSQTVVKKTPISPGIDLVLSNTDARISEMSIQKTTNGLIATISIEMGN